MAVQFWQNMSILVDDQELAGHGRNVDLSSSVAELDTTPLSTTGWRTVIGGLKSGQVSLDLMADFAENGPDSAVWSKLGDAQTVHSVITNTADSSTAYTFRGIPLSHTIIEGNVGTLATARVSGSSASSPVVRGHLIHPSSTARTSSGTGTGVQEGAVADGKSLYAALHVIAASGTSPTLDVVVQSDDNAGFTSPTSRVTFSQATTTGAQFSSVAGPITDDYWRITYTIGGTSPSFGFAVVVGII